MCYRPVSLNDTAPEQTVRLWFWTGSRESLTFCTHASKKLSRLLSNVWKHRYNVPFTAVTYRALLPFSSDFIFPISDHWTYVNVNLLVFQLTVGFIHKMQITQQPHLATWLLPAFGSCYFDDKMCMISDWMCQHRSTCRLVGFAPTEIGTFRCELRVANLRLYVCAILQLSGAV